MTDRDLIYTTALAALRKAEAEYAATETKLIQAQRAVRDAQCGTTYDKALRSSLALHQRT